LTAGSVALSGKRHVEHGVVVAPECGAFVLVGKQTGVAADRQ
jgi:hypothetical protein